VGEWPDAISLVPLEPATVGHTLVIPKQHVSSILHANDDLVQSLSVCTLEVVRAASQALKPDGLNVITSAGAAAGQTVAHLHIHVVPRWTGDNIGRIWPASSRVDEPAQRRATRQLRAALEQERSTPER
jgi:histidine triad (HIT) family protein